MILCVIFEGVRITNQQHGIEIEGLFYNYVRGLDVVKLENNQNTFLQFFGKIEDYLFTKNTKLTIFYYKNGIKFLQNKFIVANILEHDNLVVLCLKNLLYLTKTQGVFYFSTTCRTTFCSKLCTLKEEHFTYNIEVRFVDNISRKVEASSTISNPQRYKNGFVYILEMKKKFKIRSVSGSTIYLMPFDVILQDIKSILLIAGCDGSLKSCKSFKNVKNFIGEPRL